MLFHKRRTDTQKQQREASQRLIKDATQKQILLNSLEDSDNPYRAIFEVKKLDEGWDVLNLFDIVRLYETRQSGGKKISPATISEAQLIGRGARYCPFQIDDEQPKFQRKYDDDITCELRVCETLYYHCQNDHRYVTELHAALREIGLDTDKIIKREYVLKADFKASDIYKQGFIFLNEREVKDRKNVFSLMSTVRDNIYRYHAQTGASGIDYVMEESFRSTDSVLDLKTSHMTISDIAKINYAIVNKALTKYPIYKFNTLRSYFPNIASTRQFITDNNYLGAVNIEIQSNGKPTMETLYRAVSYVLGKIAGSIAGIIDAIDRENILYLTKFPKIGEKLARQIILDLKGKLNFEVSEELINDETEDLIDTLTALGYKSSEIKKVVGQIDKSLSLEDQVKESLKLLLK